MDQAYITSKVTATDVTERWFIFPEMFNVLFPSSEDEVESIDNIDFKTGDEIRQAYTYEHVGPDANPALIAAYNSFDCIEYGVFYITNKGQVEGMNDGNNNLASIKQQAGTVSAKYMKPSVGAVQKVMVKGFVDDSEYDGNLDYIPTSKITFPAKQWFGIQPLQVVPVEVSNATQDTIVFEANGLYGGVDLKKPVTGIVTTDLSDGVGGSSAVYNESTSASVAATIAESATVPGTYTITLGAAQTAGDVIRIDLAKTGYVMRTFRVTLA
ncbi:MAG: hypothetical protein HRU18_26900 [Pseudoalteromonas sp.]|uniref:hypothetical protein n=1 Tax=Pseudoalteromonas sp. TaxID=53249 RepID=UPI001D5EDD07|nr:hypothetical protein [Pseudoalteromonas sp.]NRA81842.1 hypothetical protein [Pseudoalteromonas sp.]